jgi:hypothetical protein
MVVLSLLLTFSCVYAVTFEIDGDLEEHELMDIYLEQTGDDISDLEGARQARYGKGMGKLSSRRQALIRMMFNVLSGHQKKDKSFMRKFFQYGCHCYPGGPDHLLRSGHGRPIDKIDTICQKHKSCYKCLNAIFNAGKWGVGTDTNCNPENTTYKMILNTTTKKVSCPDNQTLCRKSLCECDLEFATSITGLENFEAEYDENNLVRNNFNYEEKCPKLSNGVAAELQCCGSKNSFPYVEPLSGKKNQCCGAKAFNDQRQECCDENSIAPIGTCPTDTSQYTSNYNR